MHERKHTDAYRPLYEEYSQLINDYEEYSDCVDSLAKINGEFKNKLEKQGLVRRSRQDSKGRWGLASRAKMMVHLK